MWNKDPGDDAEGTGVCCYLGSQPVAALRGDSISVMCPVRLEYVVVSSDQMIGIELMGRSSLSEVFCYHPLICLHHTESRFCKVMGFGLAAFLCLEEQNPWIWKSLQFFQGVQAYPTCSMQCAVSIVLSCCQHTEGVWQPCQRRAWLLPPVWPWQ